MADCEADQLREEIARLAQQVQLISFLYFVCFGQWHSKLEVLDPDNFNTDAGLGWKCRHWWYCKYSWPDHRAKSFLCLLFPFTFPHYCRCSTWTKSCQCTNQLCSLLLSFSSALPFGWPSYSPLASEKIKSGKINVFWVSCNQVQL